MGIFYQPPQPPTGSTAATPPLPHDPIPPQGSSPPRYSTALMLVAVLASWPQDLEPRLARPNEQRQKIAPLTLTYGQQPPVSGTSTQTEYAVITAAWPADLEPRLGAPNNRRQTIAPLTLRYGDQPTPTPSLSTQEFQAISTWPQPDWSAQSAPRSTAWIPPPNSIARVTPYVAIIAAQWPVDLEPRLGKPNAQRTTIAPLTLTYGQQPPPQPPLSVTETAQIVATWAQTWDAQTAPKNAAWNVPPILSAVAYAPLPRSIWTAWEPPWIQPPTPTAIVTLTLPTGTAPPVRGPVDRQLVAAAAWVADPPIRPVARTIVSAPLQAQPPYTPLSPAIRAAWDTPWIALPDPVAIVTLTLPTGSAPPVRGAFDRQMAARIAWEPPFMLPQRLAVWTPSGAAGPVMRVAPAIWYGSKSTIEWAGSKSDLTWPGAL